jgi:type II secretory ATPase GspE/PulE/Tfp pilus assembly ATPase PilB-like protein
MKIQPHVVRTLNLNSKKLRNGGFIAIVNEILHEGLRKGSREITLTQAGLDESKCFVQFNSGDGTLRPLIAFPNCLSTAIGSQLKIMGKLSISQHRVSQMGTWCEIPVSKHRSLRLLIFTTVGKSGEIIHVLYHAHGERAPCFPRPKCSCE